MPKPAHNKNSETSLTGQVNYPKVGPRALTACFLFACCIALIPKSRLGYLGYKKQQFMARLIFITCDWVIDLAWKKDTIELMIGSLI